MVWNRASLKLCRIVNLLKFDSQNKFKASEAKVRLLEDGPGLYSENIGL